MSKADLKIDWATHAAAKHACENWHYSGCTPKGKQVWIGVWEDSNFKGVLSFGRSTSPYLGDAYNLKTTECCELTRIALRDHKSPVSKIMAIAIKMIKKQSSGVRLMVSLADPMQGHYGGIYQATNWIYIGKSSSCVQYYFRNKWRNDSNVMRYLRQNPSAKKTLPQKKISGKHKYLMPLDNEIRAKIEPLAKPYPKRDKQAMTDTIGTAAGQHRPSRSNKHYA